MIKENYMRSFEELKIEFSKEKEKFAEKSEKILLDTLKNFFEDHKKVRAVVWNQFTDYFNDGDACEFYVREPGVVLPEDDGYDDGYDEEIILEGTQEECGVHYWPKDRMLKEDLGELEKNLSLISEFLLFIFGDHVQVQILRDLTVHVVDYTDHD